MFRMRQHPRRTGVVMAGMLAVAVWMAGCDSDDSAPPANDPPAAPTEAPQPAAPPAAGNSSAASATANPRALLAGWETPRAVLLLTGEQHGYLEPCGCSEKQSGGMARRADLLKKLEARGWPVAGLDLGGLVDEQAQRNRGLQTWYKFQTMLAALKEMKYAAMGLGPEELRFGVDQLLQTRNLDASATDSPPTFTSANTVIEGFEDYGPARSRLVPVGNIKVGVISVIGDRLRPTIFPGGSNTGITVIDGIPAVRRALADLKEQQPDLLVLLAHAPVDESRGLAATFPDFQVIVTAGGPEDPAQALEWIGERMFLRVGKKGKNVGVLGVYPDKAGKERLRFELVNLDNERFENAPSMRRLMRDYQDLLQQEQQRVFDDMAKAAHPKTLQTGATFVGAETCGNCHTKAFEHWKTTGHARAYQSLITGRPEDKDPISRVHDPECLACHVTGWDPQNKIRYDDGFLPEALAKTQGKPALFETLKDNQCENCHGPGSKHIALEEATDASDADRMAARLRMRLSKQEALDTFCAKCHDPDNDPHFSHHEEEYWKKIAHPWRD